MKRARVVIGANFGDEGKGLVTDYLAAQGAGIVVRFNGGANAGHTVVTPNGQRHVFRHFGSGSLLEIPTYLSQFFVCNPILFFEELAQLKTLGYMPDVYAHPDCLITTYADMLVNQLLETHRGDKRHGSCGVGLHETMNRSQVKELKITLGDIWNGGRRIKSQMEEICDKYFQFRTGKTLNEPKAVAAFIEACEQFAQYVQPLGMAQCEDPVFEGAQGLCLDQNNKQFFPHVTHSNTGMKNVDILCAQAGIADVDIYYVSRTYLTRHGAGPLPGEDPRIAYRDDTNVPTSFQGALRFAPLECDHLRKRCNEDAGTRKFNLVLTHCDQKPPACDADLMFDGPCREAIFEHTSTAIAV